MTIGYGKVERSTWEDDKFLRLSPIAPSAQGLWVFLLSCPLAVPPVPGLIRGGRAALAEILRWDREAFDRCWAEVEAEGMAVADWPSRIVWLPNAVCFNPPDNPKIAIGWARAISGLPAGPIREQIVQDLSAALAEQYPACLAAFQEAWTKLTGSDFLRGSAVRRRKGLETVSETVPETVSETVSQTVTKPDRFQGAGSIEQGALSREQEQDVCPELASSSEPPPAVLTFPTTGRVREWRLRPEILEHWVALFPGLDVLACCRKALAWVEARPRRRKTSSGMEAFLTTWISKDFDELQADLRRGVPTSTGPAPANPNVGGWSNLGKSIAQLHTELDAVGEAGFDVRPLREQVRTAASFEDVERIRVEIERLTHPDEEPATAARRAS